jgi:hypothetical protein
MYNAGNFTGKSQALWSDGSSIGGKPELLTVDRFCSRYSRLLTPIRRIYSLEAAHKQRVSNYSAWFVSTFVPVSPTSSRDSPFT